MLTGCLTRSSPLTSTNIILPLYHVRFQTIETQRENVPSDVPSLRLKKTHISLGISTVCSVFLIRIKKPWLCKHASIEDSYMTARMRRLIWIFAGRSYPKVRFLTLRFHCIPMKQKALCVVLKLTLVYVCEFSNMQRSNTYFWPPCATSTFAVVNNCSSYTVLVRGNNRTMKCLCRLMRKWMFSRRTPSLYYRTLLSRRQSLSITNKWVEVSQFPAAIALWNKLLLKKKSVFVWQFASVDVCEEIIGNWLFI